jgi:hypothetical protein
MTTMTARGVRRLLTIAAGGTFLFASTAALAQQKMKFSFTAPPGVTKYTQQHVLDVSDVPGHQIRIASLHTKYAAQAPEYDGVKVVESFGWLTSDYIGGSGRFTQHSVAHMANGDKMLSRTEGLVQTSTGAEGAGKTTFSTVTTLTGGTGRFATIRGTIKGAGVTDFKTGPTPSPSEGEYWFEK